jgi:hypothetical protein
MKIIKTFLLIFSLVTVACFSNASPPTCHPHSGGPYCKYTGKVQRLYMNEGNVILMYFDSPVLTSELANVDWNITSNSAAALKISESNSDFAKTFYSTAMAALLSGHTVSIQMRGAQSGYLKIDRIWLN